MRSMAFVALSVHFASKFALDSIWAALLFGVLIISSFVHFIVCLCTIPPKAP